MQKDRVADVKIQFLCLQSLEQSQRRSCKADAAKQQRTTQILTCQGTVYFSSRTTACPMKEQWLRI